MRPGPFSLLLLLLTGSLVLSPACTRNEPPRPDCAINAGPCSKAADGLAVTLDISPRPVRAMQDLLFGVRIERGGQPVGADSVEIDLTMPGMQMGENRVRLKKLLAGPYQGRGVIVRCPSGQTIWKASVIVTEGGRVTTADFLLEVP